MAGDEWNEPQRNGREGSVWVRNGKAGWDRTGAIQDWIGTERLE